MAKSSTPIEKTPSAALSDEQRAQVALLDRELPEYPKLSNGEVGGLGAEALEGYFYGERVRWDTRGVKWHFRREAENDQFFLKLTASLGPVVLAEAKTPLDRIAGKEGEESVIALVERLADEAQVAIELCRAEQQASKTEG